MTDYTKLVEALRIRSGNLCRDDICDRCEAIHFLCSDKVMHDAAAAIEALQAKVDRLTKENRELAEDRPEMEEVNGHWEWRKPNGEAQLPKRGEWIYHPKDAIEMMFTLPKCSICGHESSDALNYCPSCGAKMNDSNASNALNALDNAQDGPIITPCRGCSDYDGYGGCKSKGGCASAKMEVQK